MAGHRQSGWGSIVPAIIWPIIVVIALTPLLFGLAPRLCRLFALLPVQLGQLSVAFVGLLIEVFPAFRLVELLVALRSLFPRSEEHTSELQSLMRISYAVFCL